MCGLGGYAGVGSEVFAWALGVELDTRGGHAAGYVTNHGWGTRVGTWQHARRKFYRRAGTGDVGILHARFATCGGAGQRDAHPFEIRRDGKPVLYGAHNGMIPDADDSAHEHNRPYTVDSRELFELIADKEYKTIQKLSGYGVAAWMKPGDTGVQLVKLTESGDIVLVGIEGGGFAFASTWEILHSALIVAKLRAESSFKLETGNVYRIEKSGIYHTGEKECFLSRRFSYVPSYLRGGWGMDDEWEETSRYSTTYGQTVQNDQFLDKREGQDEDDAEWWSNWTEKHRVKP